MAEYAMLPRATTTRYDRESVRGKIGGRTYEISRLAGRSLRACVDYKACALAGEFGARNVMSSIKVLLSQGRDRPRNAGHRPSGTTLNSARPAPR